MPHPPAMCYTIIYRGTVDPGDVHLFIILLRFLGRRQNLEKLVCENEILRVNRFSGLGIRE